MPYQAGVHRLGCFRAYAFLAPISLLATVSTAFSQPFTVTLEAPKVQQSYLTANPSGFGATNVFTEIFDELPAGFKQTSTPFAGNSAIGSYDKILIRPVDQFGGAGGTGRYMTVNRNINAADVATTLTFTSPQSGGFTFLF